MARTWMALVLGLAASLSASQQTFRTATDVVLLPVTVMGRGDTLVRGLTRDDFEVFEDGRRQTLTLFAEGAPGEALPLHLGLLLDTSGSMDADLADASSAAIRFVNALDEAVDVTFVDFASDVRMSQFSPASYPHLFERVRSHPAEGSTALHDAVARYLDVAARQDGHKVLLMYTDGEDSTSSMSYGHTLDMLRLSDVMVYAIGYGGGLQTARGTSQVRLNNLAHQSGGQAFYPRGVAGLNEIYARILDEIASRYTLGYVSTNRTADGTWRKVEIKMNTPSTRGSKARTRPGYFAPIR